MRVEGRRDKNKEIEYAARARAAFVERYPCPWCERPAGQPCDMRSPCEKEERTARTYTSGPFFHAGRFKRAAKGAIDLLLQQEAETDPAQLTTATEDGAIALVVSRERDDPPRIDARNVRR
jgi:hypothetical protein